MPWISNFIEDQPLTFQELLHAVINHMSDDDLKKFLVRDMYIRNQMMKHNFTKRQRIILNAIFAGTYPFGQNSVIMPSLRDWEVFGIQQSKAPAELQKMVDMRIITWNKETNEFSIEDPRLWEVPLNPGYNETRGRQLFILNLKHAGIDVDSIIKSPKEGGNF